MARGGEEGLLDDFTGGGFTLVARDGDPFAGLGAERAEALAELGVRPVALDPEVPDSFRDLDGRIRGWLEENGVHAALVRPDLYVFGSAATPEELPALADDLLAAFSPQPSRT